MIPLQPWDQGSETARLAILSCRNLSRGSAFVRALATISAVGVYVGLMILRAVSCCIPRSTMSIYLVFVSGQRPLLLIWSSSYS